MISKKDYAFIINAIRRAFSRSELHRKILEASLSQEKGPRGGKMYVCASCGKPYGRKDVQVDHISPVVPVSRTAQDMRLETYVKRLWCAIINLQVLCKKCHKAKSKQEASKRAAYRRRNKG